MTLSISESLLPQPPSFQKKKAYEIHKVLGEGTFGKVMVRRLPQCSQINHISSARSVLCCNVLANPPWVS